MEHFAKIFNGFQLFTILAKRSISDFDRVLYTPLGRELRSLCIFGTFLLSLSFHNLKEIESQLITNFLKLCDWFNESNLYIQFDTNKTKSLFFTKKQNSDINIEQYSMVTWLGCLGWQPLRVKHKFEINKINSKLNWMSVNVDF